MIISTVLALDSLGRITIPVKIRKKVDMHIADKISMYIVNNQIVLTKATEEENSRKIDDFGRLVLAKNIRNLLNINPGDKVIINSENNRIYVSKLQKNCVFCSSNDEENLIEYNGVKICTECIKKISNLNINK